MLKMIESFNEKHPKTALWIKAAGVRALKTMAQAALGVFGSSAVLSEIDFKIVISSALTAGAISLLTSVAGLPEVNTKVEQLPNNSTPKKEQPEEPSEDDSEEIEEGNTEESFEDDSEEEREEDEENTEEVQKEMNEDNIIEDTRDYPLEKSDEV